MNSSVITKIAVLALGLVIGLWAIVMVMGDNLSGGIGMTLKCILGVMIPVFFAKPKFGLYVFVGILANIEWLKRLGVYYGVASVTTVAEMLVIPILLLSILILSIFAASLGGGVKLTWKNFMVFVLSGGVILTIIAVRGTSTLAIQSALNAGLYISIIPVLIVLMKDRYDFIKFMQFCAWMFVPWAIWGIRQYYYGLGEIEEYYVGTNLSPVLSGEVIRAIGKPRPFGLAGSQASYGAISFLTWFCLWRFMAIKQKRIVYFLLFATYLIAVVLSGQRTALVLPLASPIVYLFFNSKAGVAVLYSAGAILLGLGITFSGDILRNLDRYQEKISVEDSGWAEKTLRITTYSDRLRGWERLKNPEVWSLFGKRLENASSAAGVDVNSKDYAHDMVNGFLINVGLVGLLPCLATLGYLVYRLHSLVFMLPKRSFERKMVAAAIAYSIPNLVLAIMGGGNFNTTPVNFFTWTFFAMALIVAKDHYQALADAKKQNTAPEPLRFGQAPVKVSA